MKNLVSNLLTNLSIFFICLITLVYFGDRHVYSSLEFQRFQGGNVYQKDVGELVYAEGTVKNIWQNKQKMTFLTVEAEDGQFNVSFFPSLGKLDYMPQKGDFVRVEGVLDRYKQRAQVSPLNKKSIFLITAATSNTEFLNSFKRVLLGEVGNYMDETVMIADIQGVEAHTFMSRQGNKILSFVVTDGINDVSGVFFQGQWNNSYLEYFNSRDSIILIAKISTYRGNISLIGENVYINESKK